MKDFSLLLSVYKGEKAAFFIEAFDSIYNQTYKPTEIILVEDGPLTPDLYSAIEKTCNRFNNIIRVPLEKNQGLGVALNIGIKHCQYEYVARMDTDDICLPQRFETQMKYLEEHPDIDVLSAFIEEFDSSPDNVVAIRKLPENHQDIYKFGKIRNPINHPVVIFRKQAVIDAGGYQPFKLFEDYYLWARMLKKGSKFHNMQQSLLRFRRSPEMIRRRGGLNYAKSEISLQKSLFKIGYISAFRMIKNICIRFIVRIFPNKIRDWFYLTFLRN